MVLPAGSALDARTGVHAPWSRDFDRLRHVRTVEPARNDDPPFEALRELPIERFAGASVQLARRSIEEQGLGIAVVFAFEVEAGFHLERFPKPDRGILRQGR